MRDLCDLGMAQQLTPTGVYVWIIIYYYLLSVSKRMMQIAMAQPNESNSARGALLLAFSSTISHLTFPPKLNNYTHIHIYKYMYRRRVVHKSSRFLWALKGLTKPV